MVQESVDTRFAKSGELLAEIDEFSNGFVGVVVCALNWCLCTKDVCEEGSMTDFLVGHELNEEAVAGSETSSLELLGGKGSKTIVEKIELDPLLIQGKCLSKTLAVIFRGNKTATHNRLVVKITLDVVHWLSPVST